MPEKSDATRRRIEAAVRARRCEDAGVFRRTGFCLGPLESAQGARRGRLNTKILAHFDISKWLKWEEEKSKKSSLVIVALARFERQNAESGRARCTLSIVL